jgi:hypothetical protein
MCRSSYSNILLGNNRKTSETTAFARQQTLRNSESTLGSSVFYVVCYEARPTVFELLSEQSIRGLLQFSHC